MNNFSDFEIPAVDRGFVGNKIKVHKIFEKQIVVIQYKIEPSKFSGDRLVLQIEYEGEKRIVFSGSRNLQDTIKKVPVSGFPFTTVIKESLDGTHAFT